MRSDLLLYTCTAALLLAFFAYAVSSHNRRYVKIHISPSYAYRIGALILDREGTLHGPAADILLPLLAEQGFTPAE